MMIQLPMAPFYASNWPRETLTAMGEPRLDHRLVWRPQPKVHPARAQYAADAKHLLADGYFDRPTLFSGVMARSRTIPQEIVPLLHRMPGEVEEPGFEYLAVRALATHIEREWKPGGKHLLYFSAGYDTRIIGEILAGIARHRGRDWIGDLRCVCWQPELEPAKVVFDYLAIPGAQWWPITGPDMDYYADALDFDLLGQECSEAARLSAGQLLAAHRMRDWIDADTQALAAGWHDEIATWAIRRDLEWGNLAWWMAMYMLDQPEHGPGECIYPYVSAEYLELLATYKIEGTGELDATGKHRPVDTWKRRLMRVLDPGLEHLANPRLGYMAHRKPEDRIWPCQALSEATRELVAMRYHESWYAHQPGTPDEIMLKSHLDYTEDSLLHHMRAAIFEARR